MRRHELSDEQFKKIELILPGRKGHVGATAKDNRIFINGVLWIFKTGAPWRDLPERYGHWKNIHRKEKEVWQRLFWEHLIRDENDWRKHMDYIHYNPVKHGLVHSPEDWPHSSFCHYVEKGLYEKNWGSMKPITFAGMNEAE